jgi:NAD(P)-dependent dehydrogenase (short-subunit alcohol dehydrogenase family)
MSRLDGKIALISGAARGIGRETAALMARPAPKWWWGMYRMSEGSKLLAPSMPLTSNPNTCIWT